MKDICIEWLSEIPAHWERKRLKHVAKVFSSNVDKHTKDGEDPVRLCNYTDVYYNDVISPDLPFMSATATPSEIERFTLRPGDVVFTKDSETADDIGIPAIAAEDLQGVVCGYHLSIARASKAVTARFIWRLFQSKYLRSYFETRANGLTRVGLGQHAVDNAEIPLPPLREQNAIAAYLDRETGRIDALAERMQRLIALLTEKRQAVISRAVAKGLNSDAPSRDDRMSVRLRHLLDIGPRSTGASDPDQLVSFLPMNAIKDGIGGICEHDAKPAGALSTGSYNYVEDGDILLAKVTPCFENGKKAVAVGLTNGRGYATSEVHVLRPRPGDIDRQFLFYVLASAQFQSDGMASMTGAGGLKRVSEAAVLDHRVHITDLQQQQIVAAHLDRETERIDALVERLKQFIALLAEKRQALVSAAVTGQVPLAGMAPENRPEDAA